jgi:recombination protein RecA
MAKKDLNEDAAMKHLKKFCLTGAKFKSPGNIPTNHFVLDFVIHNGTDPTKIDLSKLEDYNPATPLGFPLGKLVEIFGEEGGGKSSIAHRVVGAAQKLGYTAAWLDVEHSYSENLAEINGCEVDDVISPSVSLFAEDVLDLIISFCSVKKVPMLRSGRLKEVEVDAPKVIVVDSVASLIPRARAESSSEQQFMALTARLMSDNLGKVADAAEANGVLVIFVNQLREKVGVMFGNPETSPGGRALKHFCSLRLKITKKAGKDALIYIEDEETGDQKLIGGHSYVRLEKNRFAKPYLESITIPVYYEPYFPDIQDIAFDVGRQTKLITVRKGVYSWNDVKVEGRKNFIDYMKENNLVDSLVNNIKDKSREEDLLLPPELVKYEGKKDGKSKKISLQKGSAIEDSGSGKKDDKKSTRKKSP